MIISQTELQPVLLVNPQTTVAKAFEIVDRAGCDGALIEGDDGRIAVLSYGELRYLVTRPDADQSAVVGEYGFVCPFETTPETEVEVALSLMRKHGVDMAPVSTNGRITGVAVALSIRRALREERRLRVREMGRVYATGGGKQSRRRRAK